MSVFIRVLAYAVLAAPLISTGQETVAEAQPAISLKGFGTLGVAHSDDHDAQFVRDLSQPDGLASGWSAKTDSDLGLQINANITEQTAAVVQAVSRYRYDGSYTPELTWAFLRHDFSPDLTARLGRLGTEFYILADSRLVGYANLMLRPPPDYYGPLLFTYFDGLDLSAATRMESGLLRGKLFAGYAAEKVNFAGNWTWNLSGSLLLGGYLDFLTGPWQVRLGHTQVRFNDELPLNQLTGTDILSVAPELSIADTWTGYDSLGVVYDQGPLQLQGMLSRIHHESSAYESSRAAYFVAAYRLGPITPYLGYSQVKSSAVSLTTPLPPQLVAQISRMTAQSHSDQHTVSIGARWDFQPNMALKGQVDFIRGTPQSLFTFREFSPAWDGKMNVYSVALDFVF